MKIKEVHLTFKRRRNMKKKSVLATVLATGMALSLGACGSSSTATSSSSEESSSAASATSSTSAASSSSTATTSSGSEAVSSTSTTASGDKIDIQFLIKATDSDFWQQAVVGAKNFEYEHDDVTVTVQGPVSEADTAEQTEILDNIITTHPDGIAAAPTLEDNLSAGFDRAAEEGIPVAVFDNQPSTDNYISLFATDTVSAGKAVGEAFLNELKNRGVEPKGKVGLVSPMAGSLTVSRREDGFKQYLADNAPDIEVLEPIYCDNDIPKALQAAEDIYTANQSDLLGYFASNNASGDGVAQFMTENNLGDKLVACTFDSDEAEINAVKDGSIFLTAVQNPYQMGYQSVQCVYDVIKGTKTADDFDKFTDTGISLVTKENVDSEEMAGIIDPFTLKEYSD
jgi:ribose transport system substrate-binding protein